MEYRKLPRGGETISVLGMGSSYIGAAPEREICETVTAAVEQGINYFDLAAADANPFPAYGKALAGVRNQVYFQIHFGANYETGKYGWTCDLETVKRSIDWQLSALKTDYIDFGFIHCIDKPEDLEQYVAAGVLQYIQDLKAQGVARHIGGSTHSPALADKLLDFGLLDMMMFSVNAAYDYKQGNYGIGEVDQRMNLYRRCQKEGVGLSVMKPFGGGQLLDAKTSPFQKALTQYQCLQYALDKPGVLTVLPGVRNRDDLNHLLGFFSAEPEERDYSIIGNFTPQDAEGICVYCNHCQPCPAGLDVGLINKYYDLSLAGDDMAKDHYQKLPLKAGACAGCGHCESRCPFHVKQIQRMAEIKAYFGE